MPQNILSFFLAILFLCYWPDFSLAAGCKDAVKQKQGFVVPEKAPRLSQQRKFERELTELFKHGKIKSLVRNTGGGTKLSFVAEFEGTSIRAVLKRVLFHDVYEGKNLGVRFVIAEEMTYEVAQRMGFHRAFTVGRKIEEGDPILKLHPDAVPAEYVLSLILDGFKNLQYVDREPHPLYGNAEDPQVLRAEIFEWIIGNSDAADLLESSETKEVFSVDGANAFLRHAIPNDYYPQVPGGIAFNIHHYRNDKDFFDHLLTLDPEAVFTGLKRQTSLSHPSFPLRYSAAKHRLANFQDQLRALLMP